MDNFSITLAASLMVLGAVLAVIGWYLIRKVKSGRGKRAELNRLSLIASNTDNVVFLSDSQGLIEWVNPGFSRLSGYTSPEVVGKAPEAVLLGKQPNAETVQNIKAGVEAQQNFSIEMMCAHRNGHRYCLSMNFTPVFDEQQRLCNFIGIGTDITAHHVAAEELARRYRRHELLLNAAGEGIYCVDLQGKIAFINPAAAKLTGWEPGELIGRPASTLLHQLRANQLPRSQDDHFMVVACRDGSVQVGDVDLFRRKDGGVFPVEFTSKSIFDEGYLTGTVVVFRDITERWQLENTRLRQERQSRLRADVALALAVYDNLPSTLQRCAQIFAEHLQGGCAQIWLLSADETALELQASAGLEAISELHHRIPLGSLYAGLLAQVRQPQLSNDVANTFDLAEQEWVRAAKISAVAGFPLVVENRLIGVLAVFARDRLADDTLEWLGPVADSIAQVVVRKRAEETIKEQAALLDKAQDAIVVMDLSDRCVYWNKSAERLYGWLAQEVHGKMLSELIYRDTSYFERAKNEVMETGEWRGECYQVTRGDEAVIVESQWTLVSDDAGQPKSILVVNTDVTEKKRIESQFLRTQRMESIGTLAGGIAHDLNNVLAPIVMSVDVMRDKFKDDQSQRMLGIVETSAKRGADMVKQVLTFARGVDGERVHLQTRHLIKEVAKFVSETFPKSIQLRASIPPDLWPTLGDATQLHQVLVNLAVNARDAMPNGGLLTLAAENLVIDPNHPPISNVVDSSTVPPGFYTTIKVSDTGTGIPTDILEKIFEPFFTTKEVGKGTGLGLSTVLGIVKSHNGFLQVQTEVDVGTTFTVFLPALVQTPGQANENEPKELPLGNGELLLAVDDEAAVLVMAKEALETYGYRVLTAQDGAEAIATFSSHRQEIRGVLTDMVMPFMDGAATIHALRRLNPKVPIIASSGLLDNERLQSSTGLDNVSFLAKPFTTEKLLITVHKMLSETN